METTVTIGEFARLSHLSVITLRHYHDVGLLTPALIDSSSGYRRYFPHQVEQAHLIRRLRAVDMPLPQIVGVLGARTPALRDEAIAHHLAQMERALGRTAAVVASLRSLLRPDEPKLDVEYRTVAAVPALAMSATLPPEQVNDWCIATFASIYEAVAEAGVDPAGPAMGTYDKDFFEQDLGQVMVLVPLAEAIVATGPAFSTTLAGGRFAVAIHIGPYDEIDRTYGRLGTHIAENDISSQAPIREQYLIGPDHTDDNRQYRTEVWWPLQSPVRQPVVRHNPKESF